MFHYSQHSHPSTTVARDEVSGAQERGTPIPASCFAGLSYHCINNSTSHSSMETHVNGCGNDVAFDM